MFRPCQGTRYVKQKKSSSRQYLDFWIRMNFNLFHFFIYIFSFVLVLIEKTYQSLKTIFDQNFQAPWSLLLILHYASDFQLSSQCLEMCSNTVNHVWCTTTHASIKVKILITCSLDVDDIEKYMPGLLQVFSFWH